MLADSNAATGVCLLAFGLAELPEAAARAGVAGFIVPDLPYEESAQLGAA